MKQADWSPRKSLFVLIGSVASTLLVALPAFALYSQFRKHRLVDPAYQITAIIQTGPEKEALKTDCLSELLGLSADRPTPLYAFDCAKGEKRLLACPLIKEAHIRPAPPNGLYIDYTVRKPIARLADYANTAIDAEGYLFPLSPFFSPKQLPEIYLGLPPFNAPPDRQGRAGGAWNEPLDNKFLRLALEILLSVREAPWRQNLQIVRIDVSNAFLPSLGGREVILSTEEEVTLQTASGPARCHFPKLLRLAPNAYQVQMAHFFSLQKTMLQDYEAQLSKAAPPHTRFAPRIIDLRIPYLAFVENK